MISTIAHEDDHFGGITIFIRKTLEILTVDIVIEGRVLFIKTKNKDTSEILNFISVYGRASGENNTKREVIEKIIDKIKNENIQNNLFCFGDYNFVTSPLDRNTNKLNSNNTLCTQIWNDLEATSDLVDSFRVTNKIKRLYTFSSPTNSKSRLDRVFVPTSWSGKIISTVFENVQVSDHKIVRTKIGQSEKKGPGIYIFNNTLLDDPVYVQNIRNIINDFAKSYAMYGSYRILWDFLKMGISDFSKNYSIEKTRKVKTEYEIAKKRIDILEAIPKEK